MLCAFALLLIPSVESRPITDLEKLVELRKSYLALSSALALVEFRTASASSPRQYSRVLTCFPSLSAVSPAATRYCSKRGQSSGLRKSNGSGGRRLS